MMPLAYNELSIRQSTINEATLMPMGKGFTITSDPDLGGMVLRGYERYTMPHVQNTRRMLHALPKLRITAITNDAVATFMALSYSTRPTSQSKTVIGLILGTGCNAAVCLKTQALGASKKPSGRTVLGHSRVVVNTEWTLRGTTVALSELDLITRWDKVLDEQCHNPGFQPFEYMTAGSYLGEVVRLVLLDTYTNLLHIEETHLPSALVHHHAVTTPFLAQTVAINNDPRTLAERLRETDGFEESKHWTWTIELSTIFLEVERLVLRRSAAMIAAAILALLLTSGEVVVKDSNGSSAPTRSALEGPDTVTELVVAYCGGLICLYPGYQAQIQAFLDENLHELCASQHLRIGLREASEGGLNGAGVLSALQRPIT